MKSPLRISTLVAVSRIKRAPGVFDFRKTRTVIATGGGDSGDGGGTAAGVAAREVMDRRDIELEGM